MDCFIEALKKDTEENIIDELFKETIDLYSKKKGFSFLISIFLKIYKKNLCNELMEKFKEMNKSQKDNEKNMDRKEYLGEEEYKSEFKSIISEADNLLNNNGYNAIQFYGIILCYLNYYDYDNFTLLINELYDKKPNDLFEILIIYKIHFINPINQKMKFYNEFIKYVILKKEFDIFENGLNYIQDIETFTNVINENKEEIYNKYLLSDKSHKNNVKLDNNLKIQIIENIEKPIDIVKPTDIDKPPIKDDIIDTNNPENP